MSPDGVQRIDKWLWFARFAKTRSAAQTLAKSGRVRINKVRNESASKVLRIGDVLTLTLEHGVQVVKVTAVGARRGPAAEARLLYEEEMFVAHRRPDPVGGSAAPEKRPDKRARRELRDLKRNEG